MSAKKDIAYDAWVVIANVSEGDWSKQTPEWCALNWFARPPVFPLEDLEAELAGHDPYLWKAHRDVPLEEGSEMCDACPWCLDECGDELRRET